MSNSTDQAEMLQDLATQCTLWIIGKHEVSFDDLVGHHSQLEDSADQICVERGRPLVQHRYHTVSLSEGQLNISSA